MILWKNLKIKIGKFKSIARKKRVDILIYSSFFILFITTLTINVRGAFYLLALLLFIIAFIIAKYDS